MMKRLFFVVACVLGMVCAQAQDFETGSLEIRPMVGLNLSSLRNVDGAKYTLYYQFGAEAEYFVAPNIGLSGGLMYSLQGCNFDTSEGSNNDGFVKLHYLNIPLLVNFYAFKNFAIKAGIQPGFLVSSKVGAYAFNRKYQTDASSMFKKFDLAIPMGCSYTFSNWQVDARYNLSLTKLFKDDAILVEGAKGDNGYNSVIQLSVGYNFWIK